MQNRKCLIMWENTVLQPKIVDGILCRRVVIPDYTCSDNKWSFVVPDSDIIKSSDMQNRKCVYIDSNKIYTLRRIIDFDKDIYEYKNMSGDDIFAEVIAQNKISYDNWKIKKGLYKTYNRNAWRINISSEDEDENKGKSL